MPSNAKMPSNENGEHNALGDVSIEVHWGASSQNRYATSGKQNSNKHMFSDDEAAGPPNWTYETGSDGLAVHGITGYPLLYQPHSQRTSR